MITHKQRLCIPDYDPNNPEPYPGDIKPGYYSEAEVNELLEKNKDNPEALQFIQDMLDYGSRTHHSNMDTYERLQADDLAQAAVVEAIFVYNTAMRDQMLPRKPLPHPELEEQRKAPLKNLMPGAEKPPDEEKKPEQ